MNGKDKNLPDILKDLGVSEAELERLKKKGIFLPGEDARQLGVKCIFCGRRDVVYYISNPMGDIFPPGAYCYICLLERCKISRIIPFPIPEVLLDKLKLDMGLEITTPPKQITH